jgi:hypothetical protein
MTFQKLWQQQRGGDDFRRRADAVRSLPLEQVLQQWGAHRDPRDARRWHTDQGPLTITGTTFFSWRHEIGGGGAIDLVMHLAQLKPAEAVCWLEQHCDLSLPPTLPARPPRATDSASSTRGSVFCLPPPAPMQLPRVRHYLTERRGLSLTILQPLMESGTLYADRHGNAVFVMVAGKPPRAVGAELRGTTERVWRGLACGSRKDHGYFWIGHATSRRIVLCESAIDALSCYQLHGQDVICISTAGVRSQLPWLPPLIARGYTIFCGFDNDDAGNLASAQLLRRYDHVQRLTPRAHDWNDILRQTATVVSRGSSQS